MLPANCAELCIVSLMALFTSPRNLSVTEAAAKGVPGLVRSAEHGEDVVVERHGKAVAAVVGIAHLESLRRLEDDLRDAVLVLARAATDTGGRTDLDRAITALGLDRGELEAELEADLDAGRE